MMDWLRRRICRCPQPEPFGNHTTAVIGGMTFSAVAPWGVSVELSASGLDSEPTTPATPLLLVEKQYCPVCGQLADVVASGGDLGTGIRYICPDGHPWGDEPLQLDR